MNAQAMVSPVCLEVEVFAKPERRRFAVESPKQASEAGSKVFSRRSVTFWTPSAF